jgi:hypothetical protein
MVRPHTHSLTVLKRNLVLFLTVPGQDAVLLANTADLPTVMDAWEVGAWRRVVQTPRHQEAPAGVVLPGDLAFICHGLAAEGQRAGVDQGFGGAVGAAAGVDCVL